MRRCLICLICCLLMTTAVFGMDQASSVQSAVTVGTDGSCQVTLIAAIHLENRDSDLTFPLPEGAKNVRVNNARVRTSRRDSAVEVDISKFTGGNAGDFTLTFTYTLSGVVRTEGELGQVMTMPLLCGFEYPVEKLEFSVTLPGTFAEKPTYSSGYYQESIESYIDSRVAGATIYGSVTQRLQDHETLTMRLQVEEGLFPQAVTSVFSAGPYWAVTLILAALALLYWLLTMRSAPLRRIRCTTPPEGVTPGELGNRLTHRGGDLTMMVLGWAQLGYLLITVDENGRVFLHKRMDMGNERSKFEISLFRNLFAKRATVDGTGYRYAQLCRRAAKDMSGVRGSFKPGSGNPVLFRSACVAAGAVAGAATGGAFAGVFWLRILLSGLFGILAAAGSWVIYGGCSTVHLRQKGMIYGAGGVAVLWLLLGILAGQWQITLFGIGVQLLGGVAGAYGGRRSELGRQTASEILGFRHYLKTVTREELQRILRVNPDYYHEMAPYALALGVDQAFAKRFERLHQPNCTYLLTGLETNRTASEWCLLLRETAETLDARQKRLWWEKVKH